MMARDIFHRHFCHRCFCHHHGCLLFTGWLSCRCLRLLSSGLCLRLSTRNLSLSMPCCLLSADASPFVCLLFSGWLSRCLLLHVSALHHLCSCLSSPSSTPPLHLRQLVVALHLFAPPLHLDVPSPHNWLCCCRFQYAGVVAVNAQAS